MANYNPGVAILNAQGKSYEQATQNIQALQKDLSQSEWRISERSKLISAITKAEIDGKNQINFADNPELKQLLDKVIGFAEPKIDFLGNKNLLRKEQFKHQVELLKEASSQDQQKAQHQFMKINQVYQDMKDVNDIVCKMSKDYSDFIARILRKMSA